MLLIEVKLGALMDSIEAEDIVRCHLNLKTLLDVAERL